MSVEVSVIIPTYNRSSFLIQAVESVLDQSFRNFELLIIDDGSIDETKDILKRFGERINYIYQEHKGVSKARNLGIKLSKGRFISFLDSDDLWKKEKLARQIEVFNQNKELMICYTNEIWIRKGRFVNPKKKHQKYSGWIFDKCLPLCIVSLSSAMIKREVFDEIGLFDEKLLACEDYDFWLRASRRYFFYFIEEPLIIKRGGHSDQLSKKYWGMDRFRVKSLSRLLREDNLSKEEKNLVYFYLKEKCRILINGFLKRGRIEEAKRYESLIKEYEINKDE
jgi:glycosyltransferase involved in cell wall biosynthesis